MRRSRRGGGFHQEFGGSGEDSFVAVVVTKLTGALLFILLLTMAIMALIPKAEEAGKIRSTDEKKSAGLVLNLPKELPEGIDQRSYQYTFSVRGESTGPLVWAIEGNLPEGLTFDSQSGQISGRADVEKTETTDLKVQVSDGQHVASGSTHLSVWKPDTTFSALEDSAEKDQAKIPEQLLQHLIANGFGFALIWLGHFSGMGVIHRFENEFQSNQIQSDTNGNRFRTYRILLWLLTLICTGLIAYLITIGI